MRDLQLLVLEGPRTELTVRWSPAPSLHYRDPARQIQTDDVEHTETELGTVLVAELESVPGSHTVTLTVAVPPFRFPDDRDHVPVTTFAVITLRRESEPAGALARYTVVHLHGSAHTV